MTEDDSPIIDFYPETFANDMNGKKMAWQGVALLPFIDQKRLLDAMATRYPGLTEDEVRRNKWGNNVLFISDSHPLFDSISLLYGKRRSSEVCSSYQWSRQHAYLNLARCFGHEAKLRNSGLCDG
jgi:5'-3' exoribonuclease 2